MSYFECPENPAGKATLGKYKEVICDSDDHKGAIGAMALGMICYCVGFFAITTWAALMTPKMYMNLRFREVFKFMLSRWQPDVYFWGAVVILRNFVPFLPFSFSDCSLFVSFFFVFFFPLLFFLSPRAPFLTYSLPPF